MAIRFTHHATQMMEDRGIAPAWVEATVTAPDFVRQDPSPAVTRSFRAIPEAEGRILRVAHRPDGGDTLIITTHFDRGARP